MNMQITDLNNAVELDRAALIEVLGAGSHAYGWRHSSSTKRSTKYFSKICRTKGHKRYRVRKFFRKDTIVSKQKSSRVVQTGMAYL
jgi:hypothetical protein